MQKKLPSLKDKLEAQAPVVSKPKAKRKSRATGRASAKKVTNNKK